MQGHSHLEQARDVPPPREEMHHPTKEVVPMVDQYRIASASNPDSAIPPPHRTTIHVSMKAPERSTDYSAASDQSCSSADGATKSPPIPVSTRSTFWSRFGGYSRHFFRHVHV
ncbi:hypothetical protein CSAL01_08443 [Colletotrichum salicis]|uniref:Uncharacterized protein n=1 Tax=Colletotrichum salicis TaxID=1209931 RepID=A0A135V7I2_9PEZI|nr:hypothetical protein CSAL01_08443 [Colletotrichum salicis]